MHKLGMPPASATPCSAHLLLMALPASLMCAALRPAGGRHPHRQVPQRRRGWAQRAARQGEWQWRWQRAHTACGACC